MDAGVVRWCIEKNRDSRKLLPRLAIQGGLLLL